MFKAIELYGWDSKSLCATYGLIDSDFKTEIVGNTPLLTNEVILSPFVLKIANEYENRNLNVAANLALYFKSITNVYNFNFRNIKEYNYKHYPDAAKEIYDKYLNDMNQYLILV